MNMQHHLARPSRSAANGLIRLQAVACLALVVAMGPQRASAETGNSMASSAATAASSAMDKASSAVSRMGQSSYGGMPDSEHWERTHRVSRILGTDVRNRRGDKVGDVKDIVLDANGTIAYAIVSTGGFVGIGDRLHAVPWSALDTRGKKDFLIDIDKAALQKAPSFTSHDWPNFSDQQWMDNNKRFYHDWKDRP